MVLFAALMLWSFNSRDYRAMRGDRPHTNPFKSFLHSQNYWDFISDIGAAFKFFFDYALCRPYTRSAEQVDFDTAFGVRHDDGYPSPSSSLNEMNPYTNGAQLRERNK